MIVLDSNKCIECGECVDDCPKKSINLDTKTIDDSCFFCGHCIAICPVQALSNNGNPVVPLQNHKITTNDLLSLYASNRSVRRYTSRAVTEETIHLLNDAMKHYESASNRRALDVLYITDKAVIKELNDYVLNDLKGYFSKMASPLSLLFLSFIMNKNDRKRLKGYKEAFLSKNKDDVDYITFKAPLIAIFHGECSLVCMSETDSAIWAANTIALAKTMGIDHCYNGYIKTTLNRRKSFKNNLGIPEDHSVSSVVLFGYSDITYRNEVGRDAPKYTIK